MHTKSLLPRRSVMMSATLVTMTSLLFSNCANTADGRLTQAQGAGIGLTGGAVIGGLLGAATGVGWQNGAALGAAAGGVTGFAYGTHVANQKAKYKSTEEWLDACIVSAEKQRQSAVSYNRQLDGRIASLQQRVRAAKSNGNRQELQNLKKEIQQERIQAEKQVNNINSEVKSQNTAISQAGGSSRVASLRAKTSSVNAEGVSTQRKVQRLASLENQIDL